MKLISSLSRYPFGVAAEVISLDMIERGTEYWSYVKGDDTSNPLALNSRYGKGTNNSEGETPKAQ